jgi:ABC-2 type transport system ATP-binding protein
MEEFRHAGPQAVVGQKMRCEIVAALLHDPEILYLDEPTIGLDAVSKESIRAFIKEVNRKRKTTVLLTTHDLDDIEEICNRIMIIDHGRLLYDGRLDRFKKKMLDSRTLTVDFRTSVTAGALKACLNLGDDLLALQREGKNRYRIEFRFHKTRAAELLKRILSRFEVLDVAVEDEGIESIIKRVYRGEGMR